MLPLLAKADQMSKITIFFSVSGMYKWNLILSDFSFSQVFSSMTLLDAPESTIQTYNLSVPMQSSWMAHAKSVCPSTWLTVCLTFLVFHIFEKWSCHLHL